MGKHRRVSSLHTAKGRTAVAVTLGVATSAGIGGTGAAQLFAEDEQPTSPSVYLASNSGTLDATAVAESAPQILSLAEYKPVSSFASQLSTAVSYNQQRLQEELAARLPSFVKPAEGIITTGFEMRWGTFHKGIDIANAEGTPILAVADGTVIDSGPASGFGQWIRILHDDGTITVYGHMSTLDVSVGETVKAGQQIAGMGSLGFSTGPHLHFEVHPGGGDAVDPVTWLAEHGITF